MSPGQLNRHAVSTQHPGPTELDDRIDPWRHPGQVGPNEDPSRDRAEEGKYQHRRDGRPPAAPASSKPKVFGNLVGHGGQLVWFARLDMLLASSCHRSRLDTGEQAAPAAICGRHRTGPRAPVGLAGARRGTDPRRGSARRPKASGPPRSAIPLLSGRRRPTLTLLPPIRLCRVRQACRQEDRTSSISRANPC